METQERADFFIALDVVSAVLSDPLDDIRQRAYWQIMRQHMTLAEWQDACAHVLERETFHKVPLPAVFLGLAQERRQTRREEERREASRRTTQSVIHTSADDTWARLHVEMVINGIPRPGHYEDAAQACEHYATIDLDNAPDWLAEAAWWRDGAHGRPLLPSMMTERRAGEMWQ